MEVTSVTVPAIPSGQRKTRKITMEQWMHWISQILSWGLVLLTVTYNAGKTQAGIEGKVTVLHVEVQDLKEQVSRLRDELQRAH